MRLTTCVHMFKNFSAIITGGSSGLGLATAKKLLEKGAKVVVCDINRSKDLDELSGDILFTETDEAVSSAIEAAKTKFSFINCVVNCAGIGITRKTINNSVKSPHDLEEFERVLRVNTVGTFNVIRLSALAMAANKPDEDGQRGVIINTASVAAFDGQVGQVAYSASKGAIVGMTLPIARDLSRHGIRCVTIAPGLFESKMLFGDRKVQDDVLSYINDLQLSINRQGKASEFADSVLECLSNRMLNGLFDTPMTQQGLPKGAVTQLLKSVPFPNRLGRPEEFAQLVCAVIENRMMNGTTLRLDGALRMPP